MEQRTGLAAARPRAVDIAFGLALAAAACAVVFAAMVPFQVSSTVAREQQAAAARKLSTASLEQTLTLVAVVAVAIAVLFAVLVALSAFRMRQGRRRARTVLVVLTVLAVVPFNGQALLVCAVLVVADVFAFRRPASEWLRTTELARARSRV